jgi:MYXO-CTERM domain-containing protein
MGLHRLTVVVCFGCSLALACSSAAEGGHATSISDRVGLARAEIRPSPGATTDAPRFERSDKVETLDSESGFFRVHYTRAGQNAVPRNDRDGDGVPDYVSNVAKNFDAVLTFYRERGFREPVRDGALPGDHGGDDRFDVYLLDFPSSADGEYRPDDACSAATSCSGYMLLENDFDGRGYPSLDHAVRLVASHELFHAVQRAYVVEASGILNEGTAVWASEAFDAMTGDLEFQAAAYLKQPERSLAQETQGTFDAFTYGSSLFFQFLAEREGMDSLRELWEQLAADGGAHGGDSEATWLDALDEVLQAHDSSLADAFADFVTFNLYTGRRADPESGYAQGEELPLITERELESSSNEELVRVFPIAARYYALPTKSAEQLSAAAVLEQAEGLGLLIAREHLGRIDVVQRGQRSEKGISASLALEAGDVLHAVVYNTRSSGNSLRPDVCVGTAADVMACRAAHGDGAIASQHAPAADSSGCSVRGEGSDNGAWGAAAVLLIVLRRRDWWCSG